MVPVFFHFAMINWYTQL